MSELIEPLSQAVLPAIQRLQQACFGETWSDELWQKQMLSARTRIWGPGDPIQGYALFSTLLDEAELLQIAIDPGCQGRGLAAELLRFAMVRLAQEGVSRLMLEVRSSNHRAIRLYQRLGFEQDGVRKDYYPTATGREDAVLMSVVISP